MTQVTIETPSTTPAASGPQPGTPEYAAHMAQVYDDANKPAATEPTLPAAGTPPAGDPKPEGEPKPEGDKPPETEQKPEGDEKKPDAVTPAEGFAAFADVSTHLADDGTFKPESLEALTKLGVPAEVSTALQGTFQELRELRAFKESVEVAKLTETLHQAAGGKAEFDALITWGKTSLTPQEREHLDGELNGPFAAQAIELLKLRRGKQAPAGDPQLHTGASGASASLGGYKSLAEQQKDFADPRYQTDPAFRLMVRQRLALTR